MIVQWNPACVTVETRIRGMPVLRFMRHLSLISFDALAARITIFGVHSFEAGQTERLTLTHNVTFAAQALSTMRTREMIHVPTVTFSFGAFIAEDDLTKTKQRTIRFLCQSC